MPAAPFDYRYRYAIHTLIYALGFLAPWDYGFQLDPVGSNSHVWGTAAIALSGHGLLRIGMAFDVLLLLAVVCAAAAAGLRTWGAAYLGANVVQAGGMQGQAVVADGPFRYLRNPLYLGTFLHTLALALLMKPSGAIFTVALIGLYQLRLIAIEEPFLTARLGQPYIAYCAQVPRLLPSAAPRVPAGGTRPHWLQAIGGEIYMLAVALSFAIFGWQYDAPLLIRCVIIAFGVSLVARALMPAKVAVA